MHWLRGLHRGLQAEKDRMKTDEFNMGLSKGARFTSPSPRAVPVKAAVDPKNCLMLRFGKCGDGPLCAEACEACAMRFRSEGGGHRAQSGSDSDRHRL
ncbi:MAG: hypothetical protein MZU91_13110 [Desulfosudis oleivorans]|nr:hypothetical protein [Desulfosudis oleivorans]